MPPDAFAVLSHNHYDHLDDWSVRHLPATIPWFVPLGLAEFFRDRGRPGSWSSTGGRASAMDGGPSRACRPSTGPTGSGSARNATLWCSWLLDSGERRYYFAGDSGYFHGFAEIGRRFAPIDVAFLPIGAYEPRWFMRYQHVDPEEGYQAFLDLGARVMIPMHWGCFDLTDEPADLAPKVLPSCWRRRGRTGNGRPSWPWASAGRSGKSLC